MNRVPAYVAAGLAAAMSWTVHAEIYKHVDEHGHVTYSNLPAKGATKVDLGPGASAPRGEDKPAKTTSVRPANFPKVDSATQKKRDDTRKRLLLDELGAEQKSLLDAQAALDEGSRARAGEKNTSKAYLERIEKLQDTVSRHQKNIEAINRELATIR
jgi:hypothetical protein